MGCWTQEFLAGAVVLVAGAAQAETRLTYKSAKTGTPYYQMVAQAPWRDGRKPAFNEYGTAELRRLLCRPRLPRRSLNWRRQRGQNEMTRPFCVKGRF